MTVPTITGCHADRLALRMTDGDVPYWGEWDHKLSGKSTNSSGYFEQAPIQGRLRDYSRKGASIQLFVVGDWDCPVEGRVSHYDVASALAHPRNPCWASIAHTSRPDRTRSLRILQDERCYRNSAAQAARDLLIVSKFEQEIYCFADIILCLLACLALANDPKFRARRDETLLRELDHRSQRR